jgi:hypothetical protein
MAQAIIEQQRNQQTQVNESEQSIDQKRDPDRDSGIEVDMDENVELHNLNGKDNLGLGSNKQVILSGKKKMIRVCDLGNLYLDPNKKLKCTRASDCNVQLHKAQGILSDHTDSPLDAYKSDIKMSLMIRLTKDLGGVYRECLL